MGKVDMTGDQEYRGTAKEPHKLMEVTVTAAEPEMTAEQRKQHPVFSGVINYFPDAIMAIANNSYLGNEQHNPGTELHWDRSKSGDELDALMRHLMEAGTMDTDGIRHSTKVAWRALANLEKEIEQAMGGE